MKAEWAFRLFDEDGDNRLDRHDIRKVVIALTNFDGGVENENVESGNQMVMGQHIDYY